MRMWILPLLLLALTADAGDEIECAMPELRVDAADSELKFTVTQGDAPFSGVFRKFGGVICGNLAGIGKIDVWLDPSSVDSGLPEVDQLLATPAFFQLEAHPHATFQSTRIETLEKGRFRAIGVLNINGMQHEQAVEFRMTRENDNFRAQGRFTLPRLAYDLGTGEWRDTDYLANDVLVEFDARLARMASPGGEEQARPAQMMAPAAVRVRN